MRLYVPKLMIDPKDAKDDEYIMSLDDALKLKEVMEHFASFDELKRLVAKNYKKEKINIRYPGLKDIWKETKLPQGSLRETFNAVVNVFGREGSEHGRVKDKLAKQFLIARVADEFGIEMKTAKQKVLALVAGGYLEEGDYGFYLFPQELMDR